MAARLLVWRKPANWVKLYMGALVSYTLLLDGREGAQLRSNDIVELELVPGPHELALQWKKMLTYDSDPAPFVAPDRGTVYFEVGKGNGRAPGRSFFYIDQLDCPSPGWPGGGT